MLLSIKRLILAGTCNMYSCVLLLDDFIIGIRESVSQTLKSGHNPVVLPSKWNLNSKLNFTW